MQMLQMMKYAHAHGSSKSQIRRLLHGVRRQFTPLKAAFQTHLSNSWDWTLFRLHRAAIRSIEALNKATHVRPDTLVNDEAAIKSFIDEALAALEGLLVSFSKGRSAVKEALVDDVYRAMSNALIEQTFDDINSLAGKGYEIDPWIDDAEIEIEALRSQFIVVRFSGVANVTLHYGSKHDAAEIQHDFPFWLRVRSTD